MPRGIPVDPATKARAKKLHTAGKGRNEIARELGISTFAVSRISQELGFSFDRAQTAAATKVAVIDRAARRAAIVDRMYGRVEKVLDRLEADTYRYRLATATGVELVIDDDPPAKDERELAAAIAGYLQQAIKLEQVDSGDGSDGARSMLADLGRALGIEPR